MTVAELHSEIARLRAEAERLTREHQQFVVAHSFDAFAKLKAEIEKWEALHRQVVAQRDAALARAEAAEVVRDRHGARLVEVETALAKAARQVEHLNQAQQNAESALAAAEAREKVLREALLGTKRTTSQFGTPCWCNTIAGTYCVGQPECQAARTALSLPPDQPGDEMERKNLFDSGGQAWQGSGFCRWRQGDAGGGDDDSEGLRLGVRACATGNREPAPARGEGGRVTHIDTLTEMFTHPGKTPLKVKPYPQAQENHHPQASIFIDAGGYGFWTTFADLATALIQAQAKIPVGASAPAPVEARPDDEGTCPVRAVAPKCIRDEGHQGGHWFHANAEIHLPPAPVESAPGAAECVNDAVKCECGRTSVVVGSFPEGHVFAGTRRKCATASPPAAEPGTCPECEGEKYQWVNGTLTTVYCWKCGGTGRRDTQHKE